MKKKIPTSLFQRSSKLLGVAAKVALSEMGGKLPFKKKLQDHDLNLKELQRRIELTKNVVQSLSHLKGASMKLGQLLSLDLGDYLPPEIIRVLSELHNKSSFLPFEDIESLLQRELKEKFSEFESLSTSPIAAASIGQVHKAILHGQEVVIKVQYPGIDQTIPSDMKVLEFLVKQLRFFTDTKNIDFSSLLTEVETVLTQETDYLLEARMQEKYRSLLTSYHIPEVKKEFSTSRVLTQEFVQGVSLSEWIETHQHDKAQKVNMAHKLLHLYLEEFSLGLVQTDPNPGNFLISSQDELALIDFGAVKEYPSDFIQKYKEILIHLRRNDLQKVLDLSFELSFIDPRENETTQKSYLEMMSFFISPLHQNTEFIFNNPEYIAKARELSIKLSKQCRFSPPPQSIVFLHRKLGGVISLLKKMEVSLDLQPYWKKFIENS